MKRLQILSAIAILMAVFCAGKAQSPIATWSFNENTGTTTTDGVGGVTGTLMGSATWSDDAFTGTSVLLNGTTDYVEIFAYMNSTAHTGASEGVQATSNFGAYRIGS